jgi:spore germination protein GerM
MTRLRLLLLGLALVLAACGIGPETQPTPIDVPRDTGTEARVQEGGPREVTVYFVRGGRLVRVERDVPDASMENRLGLLLLGPTKEEARDGLMSAVPPQSLRPVFVDAASGVVYVEATPAFTQVSGSNQLLAVAQVVWTATEHPGTSRVSIVVDGQALEVPTDSGLSRVPVRRDQYASVAPVAATEGG